MRPAISMRAGVAERGAGNHADDEAAGGADGQRMDSHERGSTPNWVSEQREVERNYR